AAGGRHPARRGPGARGGRGDARPRAPLPHRQAPRHQHGLGARPGARHHAARGAPLRGRRRPSRAHRPAARPLAPGRARRPQPRPLPPPAARAQGERVVRRGPSLVSRPKERLQAPADVIIDTRPLWRILAGHTYRPVVLGFGLLAFLALRAMPPPAGLTAAGQGAVAAMTFPITVEIARVLRLPRQESNYGRALFLAMAWGTQIGGIATLLGGGRAPLALGMLRDFNGQTYSFAQWTLVAWPLVVVLLVAGWQVIVRFFPIDITTLRDADVIIAEKALSLGRPSGKEKSIALVMLGTLTAWIIGGEEFGLASIALGAVVLLFLLDLLAWRDIEQYVNWGVLLMYGGAIALGPSLNRSGASTFIASVPL